MKEDFETKTLGNMKSGDIKFPAPSLVILIPEMTTPLLSVVLIVFLRNVTNEISSDKAINIFNQRKRIS